MLNRRLWILFVLFVVAFIALGLRLGRLQISEAHVWQARMRQYLHRHHVVETYRGTIYDRHGMVLAQDVPSDELAIDYRAMNLDDAWLGRKAVERLREGDEWGRFPNREARNRRLQEVKSQIAAQIETIPDAIAEALAPFDGVPQEVVREQILLRYRDIRARIQIVRQDVFSRRFDRETRGGAGVSSTGATSDDIDDDLLDTMFRRLQLEDEVAAHTIRASIPNAVALHFKQRLAEFPGLVVRDKADRNRREYPLGEAAAHLVGTLRSVSPETYSERANRFGLPDLLTDSDQGNLAGYLPGDRMGESGIERLAELQLRGIRGTLLIDLSADPADTSKKIPRRVEPIAGRDIQVTLDGALQRDLHNALKDPSKRLLKGDDGEDHFAALVVMALDGQVLAAVTHPSYDPNTIDITRGQLMRDDHRFPLLNRATGAIYHPGSTIKPLLAAAALNESLIAPGEHIQCNGHYFESRRDIFRCDAASGHGPMEVVEALSRSCNVYFYTVGQRMGVARLAHWYGGYGFGQTLGFELPEARGNAPRIADADEDRARSDALFLGIGQGPIDVTPLQLTNAYATLLRGGIAIPPRIVAESPATPRRVLNISPQSLATVRRGMEQCVTEGTGRRSFAGMQLRVAGKTGTAEKERLAFDPEGRPIDDLTRPLTHSDGTPQLKPDGTPAYRQLVDRKDDAWFVGYAPADNPRYIVAAVMEWGGHGGTAAAPMVREAFLELQRHNYLPRTDVP